MALKKKKHVKDCLDTRFPANPSTPPSDGRCVWDKLPAELKDIIFEMAYVTGIPVKPLPVSVSNAREKQICEEQGLQYWPGRFRGIAEQRFMVSREWCSAALEVFYSCTEFYLLDDKIVDGFLLHNGPRRTPRTYTAFIRSVIVAIDTAEECEWEVSPCATFDNVVYRVNQCLHLHSLTILCDLYCLSSNVQSKAYEGIRYTDHSPLDGFDKEDWLSLTEVECLMKLRAVPSLSVIPVQEMEKRHRCSGGHLQGPCFCQDRRLMPFVVKEDCVEEFKLLNELLSPVVARPRLES